MSIAPTEGRPLDGPGVGGGKLLGSPAAELWAASAAGRLKERWAEDPIRATTEWAKTLADRNALPPTYPLAEAAGWGWLDPTEAKAATAVLAKAGKVRDSRPLALEQGFGPASSLYLVAQAYALPALAKVLDAAALWRVVERLLGEVEAAQAESPGEHADGPEVLSHQLLAGEAGLVLAALLDDVRPARALRKPAIEALSEGLLAVTDGEGLLPARCLPAAAPLLACWTRCRAVASQVGKKCFDSSAQLHYEWLVRQMLRLARPDGSITLGGGAVPPALWTAALGLGGDEGDLAAAGKRIKVKAPASLPGDAAPEPSVNSEWSGVAVLSSGWKPKAPRLTVAYDDAEMRIEAAAGKPLVSGSWPIAVTVGGEALEPAGAWEEQCWFADDQSDYLELGIELAGGAKLERQVFLAHDLGVAFLGEIVLTRFAEPTRIELQSRLPLAAAAAFAPDKETRDGWIMRGDARLAGVAPVGLAEWRIDPRSGELEQAGDALVLRQSAKARNLSSPLVLDLKPGRFAKQRTWRQLTVAEQLERVDPEVAVGYRYQSGKDQLVVYRSLDPPANRTVLGQNYASEAVIGRFLKTGLVDEYFEVDAGDD
ncbi:MAG: hypothetical protein AAGJ46_09640 [Planctomycetota bacterium]